MKLRSNTILITGGGSGIGYELTRQLTALGNTILITGRDQAKMDRAKAAFPNIHTFRSDVSDPKAIATLYEEVTKQFPKLNILINNAGIMREINIHDKAGSLEDITREIEINLSGPIRMVKQFLPHLKTKSEAAIMNVSSLVRHAITFSSVVVKPAIPMTGYYLRKPRPVTPYFRWASMLCQLHIPGFTLSPKSETNPLHQPPVSKR
jgi:short-subunit dehydrogenase involved in D-alanine esterification of teichoic acids